MVSNKADSAFNSLIAHCLQGRCREGLRIAKRIALAQLRPTRRRIVQGFIDRFSAERRPPRHSRDPIQELICIYEEYWHQALLNSDQHAVFERKLFQRILAWLKDARGVELQTQSREKIIDRLKKEIERMGYFCITGTVTPFQELEIWTTQRRISVSIRLPETKEKVITILMSDFLTKGWMAYATLGLHYPGGWAKKEGLYCNTHAYDLKSEKFRVSFLGHEAQHYSDYKRFPRLTEADLEYRAKLTEFALARMTAKRMYQVYSGRAAYNQKSPHALSYFCVVRDLAKTMKGHEDFKRLAENPSLLKSKEINAAAVLLIKRHSEALKAMGAKSVRTHIA